MGLDDGAEFFEPAQCDKVMTLVSDPGQLEILYIRIDSLGRVLFQHALDDPVAQIRGGPRVLIILAVVGGVYFPLDNPHEIIGIFLIKILLLIGTDHVIRRSDTIPDVAHNIRIKPKCFKWLNLHS